MLKWQILLQLVHEILVFNPLCTTRIFRERERERERGRKREKSRKVYKYLCRLVSQIKLRKNILVTFLPKEVLKIQEYQNSHATMTSFINNGPLLSWQFGKCRQWKSGFYLSSSRSHLDPLNLEKKLNI